MRTTDDTNDIGHDFRIDMVTRRAGAGGRWVRGRISGHRFDALVFPEHAECPEYELADSRISKLWIYRTGKEHGQTVFNWDRGADVPACDATAQAIVDFLAGGLADLVYAR